MSTPLADLEPELPDPSLLARTTKQLYRTTRDDKIKYINHHQNTLVKHQHGHPDDPDYRMERPYHREVYEHFRPAVGRYHVSFSTMSSWLKDAEAEKILSSKGCSRAVR